MFVNINLQVVIKAVMMNKLHYLHVDKGDPEITAELEVHPEVIPLALEDEAMAEEREKPWQREIQMSQQN